MTVAVLGASGTIGPEIVGSLRAKGAAVRVLARDGVRARTVLATCADGVDIRTLDIGDEAALAAQVAGCSSLLLLTSHSHETADLQLRILRALRRMPVRVVKISGTSSAIRPDGPYACRQHWEVETVLEASEQPYVVLRPNAFMQTLLGRMLLPAVAAGGRVANAIGDAGISFVDARDIGEVAASVLLSEHWDGQTLVLTGPRAVTFPEIAATLAKLTGKPVPVDSITPADIRKASVARGLPVWEAEHFEEMYQLFRDGQSTFVSEDVAQVTGRAPRTVEAYLEEQMTS